MGEHFINRIPGFCTGKIICFDIIFNKEALKFIIDNQIYFVANYDQNPAAAFNPKECQGTEIKFSANTLQLSGKGPELFATANVPLTFTAADPVENRQQNA